MLLSAGLVLVAASCDDEGGDISEITAYNRPDPSEPSGELGGAAAGDARCVPGQTLACLGVCGGFGLGYQVCAADGRAYEACNCPPEAPISSIDRPGGPIVVPPRGSGEGLPPVQAPGGTPSGALTIGAICERDADCGGRLNCFAADSDSLGFGGPARGYCSLACDAVADCTDLDADSTCGTVGGRSMCLHVCRAGATAEGSDKCLGRPDLTCLSVAALGGDNPAADPAFGICIPSCQSDAGCAGRRCDLSTGLCSDDPRAGAPIGAACDAPATCAAGLCLGATETSSGFCSAFCTMGAAGCGYDGSEASVGAGCLLPRVPGEGAGDRGLCFELCDVADDCAEAGFDCAPDPRSERAGVCLPGPVSPEGTELPSSDGLAAACEEDADCDAGLTCLSSASDPFGVGGGPAEGYCSSECESAADCPSGSGCALVSPGLGYCLATCDPDEPNACGGRETAPCVAFDGSAVCTPFCNDDAQCGERVCDFDLGLCVDAPAAEPGCSVDDDCDEGVCDVEAGECIPEPEPESECSSDDDCDGAVCDEATATCSDAVAGCLGNADCSDGVCDVVAGVCIDSPPTPIGAACSEDVDCTGAEASTDDGRLCLSLTSAPFCSAVCLWGTPIGCEAYGADAFCVLPLQDDLGACLELCNLPEDCEQPDYLCRAIGTVIDGRSGACLPPPEPATPAP